jgi:hypothetical protein
VPPALTSWMDCISIMQNSRLPNDRKVKVKQKAITQQLEPHYALSWLSLIVIGYAPSNGLIRDTGTPRSWAPPKPGRMVCPNSAITIVFAG